MTVLRVLLILERCMVIQQRPPPRGSSMRRHLASTPNPKFAQGRRNHKVGFRMQRLKGPDQQYAA
jgi:hypothetical protein